MSRRFRMTVWPSSVPVVSTVWGFSPYRLDGDLLKLEPDAQIVAHKIPDELYLRELQELDLANTAEIVGFVNTYGRLGHTRGHLLITFFGPEAPWPSAKQWEQWHSEIDGHSGFESLGPFEKTLFDTDGLQHIDAFRSWTLAFRRVVELIGEYQQGVADESEMENVAIAVSTLLDRFHPVIEFSDDVDMIRTWEPDEASPRLENLLALQIFNHLAGGDTYHVCANESHQGLFVRQRGRAAHGQHRREGVIYCSAACAKAQASRQYRRRRKAKEKEEKT